MEGGFYSYCKGGSDVKLMTVSCCRIIVTSTLTTIIFILCLCLCSTSAVRALNTPFQGLHLPVPTKPTTKGLAMACESNESHNRHSFERCETGYLHENWGFLGRGGGK